MYKFCVSQHTLEFQIRISLLYILNSILSYMKLSYSKKIQFLIVDVCSYKLIRSVDINRLVKHDEPFNSQLVSCIDNYYQIFIYLHTHIGKMHHIVPIKYIDTWYDQLYESIHEGYSSYLYASAELALNTFTNNQILVPLFEPINRTKKSPIYDFDIESNIARRNQLYQLKMNVKFTCHSHVQVILSIR